jgi:spermidine synthase
MISGTDPALAPRLYEALREPFSAHAVDNQRRLTQLDVATRFDFKGRCMEPIAALEPHVPWEARFLPMRRDCYQLNNDPRAARANRDLVEFMAREPLPIARR